MTVLFNKLLFVVLLGVFASCVGTVQEAAAPGALENETPQTNFAYDGLINARAIAHDKIEIEFYPAPGASSDIRYLLQVNESQTDIEIDLKGVSTGPLGQYIYTIKNLTTNQDYKLKLKARNVKTFAISQNEREFFVRTMQVQVAQFSGVSKVSTILGQADRAIKVEWVPSTMTGTLNATPFDTVCYEITIISQAGGAANLNNNTYQGTDKLQYFAPTGCGTPLSSAPRAGPFSNPSSIDIPGLIAETTYYVQVRARHKNWDDWFIADAVNNPYPRESNTKYISVRTSPASNFAEFNIAGVVLSNPPGISALSKLDVFWQSGAGIFYGYRIFYEPYTGAGSAYTDENFMNEAMLVTKNANAQYVAVNSTETYAQLTSLLPNIVYQVKVALCKHPTCPVAALDPNAAVISSVKAIRIAPTLSPFSGITSVGSPTSFNHTSRLTLFYNPPSLTAGYATDIKYYCVNPLDRTQQWPLSAVALTGTVPSCNGLSLSGAAPALTTGNQRLVDGATVNGVTEYCFSASPELVWSGGTLLQSTVDRIVRCAYPDIRTPNITQFPGLLPGCSITSGTSQANVLWTAPTGGIYSHYKVFVREKDLTGLEKFSFNAAVSGDLDYAAGNGGHTSIDLDPSGGTSYTTPDLIPGRTYEVGVLAKAVLAPERWSEFNTSIQECYIPLPKPTFNGFTRIVALGPKIDGRIPDSTYNTIPTKAKVYEAFNAQGEPYEVTLDAPFGTPSGLNYQSSPLGTGTVPTSYAEAFDGAQGSNSQAMSREGMITLAWEDVSLDYTSATTLFNSGMTGGTTRSNRKFGYRVLRSDNNKLTWKDISNLSGMVWSSATTLYPRPNATGVPKRIAFFTDYSVKSLNSTEDTTRKQIVDRARVYWYRILPYFDGKPIPLTNISAGTIKVTLPPPNMALVHRSMANRAQCLELGLTPDINNHYRCDYTGLGSVGKTSPYTVGQTVLDMKGDLLIDRFELGCRYTRGDLALNPSNGESYFYTPDHSTAPAPQRVWFALFKGFVRDGTNTDTIRRFQGCVGRFAFNSDLDLLNPQLDYNYPGAPTSIDYHQFLVGDCVGNNAGTHSKYGCLDIDAYTSGGHSLGTYFIPGFFANPLGMPVPGPYCFPGSANSDRTIDLSLSGTPHGGGFGAGNRVMQSEFLAVFHNATAPFGNNYVSNAAPPFPGPKGIHNPGYANNYVPSTSNCHINLAALDGSGYMRPRWVEGNMLAGSLNFKNQNNATAATNPDFVKATVDELIEVGGAIAGADSAKTFFDPDAWKLPPTDLRDAPKRFNGNTRVGRLYSSTAAKLPPLSNISQKHMQSLCETYWVQVGAGTDAGGFAPEAAPAPKHATRRREFVAASLWAEEYDQPSTTAKENSCLNATKATAGATLLNQHGEPMISGHAYIRNTGSPGNSPVDAAIWTGSSSKDPGTSPHTESCVSRFGVQDLLGNLMEVQPEQILCDYSKDKIFYGAVTGSYPGTVENVGDGTLHFPFGNIAAENGSTVPFLYGGPGTFTIKFTNGDPSLFMDPDFYPWVQIDAESGYCSLADQTPESRTDGIDPGKAFAESSGQWNSLFLPGGALNTALLAQTPLDPQGLATLRNGDGYLLDFGTQSLGAQMARNNALALNGASLYFNPILGLPLTCAGNPSACESNLLGAPDDNTKVSITNFAANLTNATKPVPPIANFPIGGSEITNIGVSAYNGGVNPVMIVDEYSLENPVFTEVTYPSRTQMELNPNNYTGLTSKTYNELGVTVGQSVQTAFMRWNLQRESKLGFHSGGSFANPTVGRFSTDVQAVHQFPLGPNVGGRCAIMINQDP